MLKKKLRIDVYVGGLQGGKCVGDNKFNLWFATGWLAGFSGF